GDAEPEPRACVAPMCDEADGSEQEREQASVAAQLARAPTVCARRPRAEVIGRVERIGRAAIKKWKDNDGRLSERQRVSVELCKVERGPPTQVRQFRRRPELQRGESRAEHNDERAQPVVTPTAKRRAPACDDDEGSGERERVNENLWMTGERGAGDGDDSDDEPEAAEL